MLVDYDNDEGGASNHKAEPTTGSTSSNNDGEAAPAPEEDASSNAANDTTNSTNIGNDNHDATAVIAATTQPEQEPKFQVKQRVFARDTSSGLWYEAIIRRSLWGVHHNKQVPIGMVCDEQEFLKICETAATTPMFQYFVHYLKWNVTWDRWVSEADIMDVNDEWAQKIVEQYQREHKHLQQELKQNKSRGGKQPTKIDGTTFLKEWRKRMDKIDKVMKLEEQQEKDGNISLPADGTAGKETCSIAPTTTSSGDIPTDASRPDATTSNDITKPAKKKKKSHPVSTNNVDRWDKASLEREYQLQLRGLESRSKNNTTTASSNTNNAANTLSLPFSLKKVMVEAWEIITQCQMVPNLPASITVRDVLNKYLESKLALLRTASKNNESKNSSGGGEENNKDRSAPQAKGNDSIDTKMKDSNDANPTNTTPEVEESEEDVKKREIQEKLEKQKQEWIDMVEGIAMFFDEALPFRLLYTQELAQYKVVESTFVVPLAMDASNSDPNSNTEKKSDNEETKDKESSEEATTAESSKGGEGKDNENDKMEVDSGKVDEMETDPMKNDAATSKENPKPSDTDAETAKRGATENDDNMQIDTVSEAAAKETSRATTSTDDKKSGDSNKKTTRPMLPCEVYGCEHLLRLCLKIPEVLAEQKEKLASPKKAKNEEVIQEVLKAYEKETKQILAKVNDLIRFLHKHQSTMFADSYRKPNEAEVREEHKWVRYIERKRKRALEEKQEKQTTPMEGDDSKATATSTLTNELQ